MRALFAISLLAACGGTPPPTTTPGPTGEPIHGTPHNESTQVGPLGAPPNECGVYLYAWDATAPGCKLSVSHCARGDDGVTCLSCLDERVVACGASEDVCGQPFVCDCPTGEAPIVEDPPGAIVLSPSSPVPAFRHPDPDVGCEATPEVHTSSEGMDVCSVRIHQCANGECFDMTQSTSCGGRLEMCGRPTVCRCAP